MSTKDVKRVYFTAKQLSLVTQLLQAIGVLMVAYGVIDTEKVSLIVGVIVSAASVYLAMRDGGANDTNTAVLQRALGVRPDSKPGPKTLENL